MFSRTPFFYSKTSYSQYAGKQKILFGLEQNPKKDAKYPNFQ